MAPDAKGRSLLIRYCIDELKLFQLHMHRDRETGELYQWLPDRLIEWYAVHTLRRMFRMRFGCSMFDQEEQSGRIKDIRLTQDRGFQAYQNAVGKAYRNLEGSVEE